MQDYVDMAEKNGVNLLDHGSCQFCGAAATRGVHECVENFNLGFAPLDYGNPANHLFRFLSVDAHMLQHPELHGRWNNHFHLTRLHLILDHDVKWSYALSPRLSDHLNRYKAHHADEVLGPPVIGSRGAVTVMDVSRESTDVHACRQWVRKWAVAVYGAWDVHHPVAQKVASGFLG